MNKLHALKDSNWTLVVLMLLQVFPVYWLITGNNILLAEVVEGSGFPAGTVIAWVFLLSFPLMTYLFLIKVESFFHPIIFRMLKRLSLIAVFCGLFWGVISFFLAENWRFEFTNALQNQDARSQTFTFVTAFPVITSLVIGLVIAIGAVVAAVKKSNPA